MQETTDTIDDTRIQLNRIADYWTSHDELPEEISWDTVTGHAHTIQEALEEQIQNHANETSLTVVEAEVWGLAKMMIPEPGFLTTDAIALVMAADNCPFHTAAKCGAITTDEAEEVLARAEEKVEAAERLAMLAADPDFGDDIDNPEVAILDRWTLKRLKDLAEPGDRTIDAVVQRHCDAVETQRELGAFCDQLLDEIGRENVAQIAVPEQSFEGSLFSLTVHGNASLDDVDVVSETDAITIADRRFDFNVEVDPYGPSWHNCTTIYGVNPPEVGQHDIPRDEVALADGVEALKDRVADRISDKNALSPGTSTD